MQHITQKIITKVFVFLPYRPKCLAPLKGPFTLAQFVAKNACDRDYDNDNWTQIESILYKHSVFSATGKSKLSGRLSTVDLLALTSSNLLLLLKIFFTFFKTRYFNKEVICTEPSPQLVFPAQDYSFGSVLNDWISKNQSL